MTANKIVFGITGPSGSGKSYISDLFRQRGVDVFDADKIAREVVMPDGAAYGELYAHFGKEYFDEKGLLLRKKLADTVFSDKLELGILNEITHKHIKKQIETGLKAASEIAAIDGAVIIGSPVEDMCEFLVGVVADKKVRTDRIVKRDNIDASAAEKRFAAQPSDSFYKEHCRYIIENNGDGDLAAEVDRILYDIRVKF